MTGVEVTKEEAFWAEIGARPDDQLPRLVFADWLEEQAGEVECGRCEGGQRYGRDPLRRPGVQPHWYTCSWCSGTGRVSNGFADMAAALRATADRVPSEWAAGTDGDGREYVFERSMNDQPEPQFFSYLGAGPFAAQDTAELSIVECEVFDAMDGESGGMYFMLGTHGHRRYPTAADAVRDLCRAWVIVYRVKS